MIKACWQDLVLPRIGTHYIKWIRHSQKPIHKKIFFCKFCCIDFWQYWVPTLAVCVTYMWVNNIRVLNVDSTTGVMIGKNPCTIKVAIPCGKLDLGFFSEQVLVLFCHWRTGAFVVRCPSWHHQWPWWDLNIPPPPTHRPWASSTIHTAMAAPGPHWKDWPKKSEYPITKEKHINKLWTVWMDWFIIANKAGTTT